MAGFGNKKTDSGNLPRILGNKGDVRITLASGSKVTLHDCVYVPDGIANLFAVRVALVQLNKIEPTKIRLF